ncbi:hypothetical protein NE237_025350 [Protea cynaroides]|uniref:Uncharacterized protein n=1 Tax=Protea cynaroides TaxID=273540 RepID=A0A9Q0H6W6_9MAGN|nr:hypothetical protein NE237_025350 [Protea cynaroides]
MAFLSPQSPDTKLYQRLLKVSSISSISRDYGKQVFSFVAFMCWNLWKARNDFYFENVDCSPMEICQRAKRTWKDFFATVSTGTSSHQQEVDRDNTVRCNLYGYFQEFESIEVPFIKIKKSCSGESKYPCTWSLPPNTSSQYLCVCLLKD